MSASEYFSKNYAEARGKFLDAASEFGVAVDSIPHPGKGPDGGKLFTDVIRVGEETAENLFIANSATHGVEGFCGSGSMVGYLRSGLLKEVPTGIAVVLVHAINPHGFSHERRVTEDNVDLNRNFVDHEAQHPSNPAYDELHSWLVPADWDGPARADAEKAIEAYIAERGMETYQTSVTGGQYDHADGLFYGGRAPTWSHRTWRQILTSHAAGRRRVAFLDFHTGLGRRGYGELQYESGPDDPEYIRAQQWYDGEVTSPFDGSSSSAAVSGYIGNAVDDIAPDAERTKVGLEYGTVPLTQVIDSLRADNWLYIHGQVDSPLGREIKAAIRAAFYGDDDAWKQDIWDRAAEVYCKTLAGLSQG